jgi:rod shape determining protein RodA
MGKLFSFRHIDWVLVLFLLPILGAGLVTMTSFGTESSLFWRQLLWIGISFSVFFAVSFFDVSVFKKTRVLVGVYGFFVFLLIALFFFGSTIKGAQSWFNFGFFSFQPSDLAKVALVLILAKYFSRRHVEIANVRHVIISGIYMLIPFLLVFLQPDFGTASIILLIWFGMILVSGINKKHLFLVIGGGIVTVFLLWTFVFADYQKARIKSFLNPLTDIQGTGYNAYQSTIAVGSGQMFGKGVGYGTQSRLQFLPEYETDFIFAAFSEEWGFLGAMVVLLCYMVVLWRIIDTARKGATNFETLFGVGVAVMFMAHITINVGMNIGLMPVTGITLPFMSHGGSHLLTEFIALGILMSMRRDSRAIHRDDMKYEFFGY